MTKHVQSGALLLLAGTLLTGCGGASSDGGSNSGGGTPALEYSERQIDATSSEDYVYLNLETNEILPLTAAEAATSTDWHLAVRRFSVQLNGGASGPGNVAGALVAAQNNFYDGNGEPLVNVFTNATPTTELVVFSDNPPLPANWISDSIVTLLRGPSSVDGGWYRYNGGNGIMTANPDNGWLLRSGEGNSYARMRATDIYFRTRANVGVENFTFEFDVQVPGTEQFTTSATFTGTLPPEGGEACFDFDTDATVACTGTAWDLKIGFAGRDFYLRSNGGVSGEGNGAVLGSFEWSDLKNWESATIEPGGTNLAPRYQEDVTSGVFEQYSWYAYDLTGMHRLWPNYRVYAIDTDRTDNDAPVYLLQITGYYDATGASGYPRLRWRRLETGE